MIRLDGHAPKRVEAVLRFCQRDPFWQNKILSGTRLRQHFDQIQLQMGLDGSSESRAEMIARMEPERRL